MYEFTYVRPHTIKEALILLAEHEEAKLLGGGMTLVPTLKQRLAQPSHLVDVSKLLPRGITVTADTVRIGAGATHSDVAGNDNLKNAVPALSWLADQIGDPMVRNRGTIGGSIANNDPAADYPAALVALNARILTTNRTIEASDFFVDMFETNLDHSEIVLEILFAVPERAGYGKFPNPASGYAVSGAFVAQSADDLRVAIVGAGPNVFRLHDFETALRREFSSGAVSGLSVDPDDLLSDLHADADYRAALTSAMVERAIEFACAHSDG